MIQVLLLLTTFMCSQGILCSNHTIEIPSIDNSNVVKYNIYWAYRNEARYGLFNRLVEGECPKTCDHPCLEICEFAVGQPQSGGVFYFSVTAVDDMGNESPH